MPRPKPDNTDRDRAILAKHTLGMTTEAIAAEYDITRQRVSQIIKAAIPRAPGEAERAEVAATLRRKYDELQAIIDAPPARTTAIGKTVTDPDSGKTVRDMSVVVRAIAEQAKLQQQYRQMFSTDITQPPAPLIDARMQVMVNQINVARAGEGLAPLRQLSPAAGTMSPAGANAACDASLPSRNLPSGALIIPASVAAGGAPAIHAYLSNQQYRAQHAADIVEGEIIDD